MDGATLLKCVRDTYPTTIRMILSGYATPEVLSQAAAVAHRFLGKPCNVAELALLIERSLALRKLTEQAEAYRVTAAATALPTRPGLYTQLTEILSNPTWTPDQIAAVIEGDPAMTAKVLQLGNSAFFGVSRRVTRVRDAVMYVGVETIKSLTLTVEAFGTLAPAHVPGFSIDDFQHHAMLVARIAAAIVPAGRAQQEAVTAALLHDIGKLVLIADDPHHWERLREEAFRLQIPFHEVEENGMGSPTRRPAPTCCRCGDCPTELLRPSPTTTTRVSFRGSHPMRSQPCISPTRSRTSCTQILRTHRLQGGSTRR